MNATLGPKCSAHRRFCLFQQVVYAKIPESELLVRCAERAIAVASESDELNTTVARLQGCKQHRTIRSDVIKSDIATIAPDDQFLP